MENSISASLTKTSTRRSLRRARTRLVAVFVNPGHGCTTLSRYIFNEVRKNSVERGIIPVRIALNDFQQEQPMRALEEMMRREIVLNLISQPWDQFLDPREYADLIGAVGTAAGNAKAHILALRAAFSNPRQSPNWKEVGGLSRVFGHLQTLFWLTSHRNMRSESPFRSIFPQISMTGRTMPTPTIIGPSASSRYEGTSRTGCS